MQAWSFGSNEYLEGSFQKGQQLTTRRSQPRRRVAERNVSPNSSMRILITACFASLLMSSVIAAELADLPAIAKTTEQITGAAEKIKGFGIIQSAEFTRMGRRVFALWYCPFSGRDACYLRAYCYDPEKVEWRRFVDRLIDGTVDLSAEMPSPGREEVIIFRNVKGEIVLKESVADLPRQLRP